MKYAVTGKVSWKVYSVGPNGTDDGGTGDLASDAADWVLSSDAYVE